MGDGVLFLGKSKEKNIPGAAPPSTNNPRKKDNELTTA
jgi:hypothetical protein